VEQALADRGVGNVGALHGSHSPEEREATIAAFKSGAIDVLVTKAQLVGYGLNFQNCRAMVFSGFDDSYERMYQAVRRAYRFGQTETVHVHVPVIRELEGMIFDNLQRKQAQFDHDVEIQERYYRDCARRGAGVTLTVTDLFCGAGGSSIGAEMAGAELRLGLNHWTRAIETHATNFPNADHECDDIAALTTAQIRRYPDTDILLASPECTNHSLAKGALRRKPQRPSLFDDGPAGDEEQDRSRATMWDVPRFAEQKLLKGKPYKAIVVENVVDAFKWGYDDDGGLFQAWLQAMRALGYESEIVYLNSMFCPPTPQSRDRMYVVFWRKGQRRPDLRVEPPSWCPACEAIVEGRQAWKKPTSPWGRYGAQYLYRCPLCIGPVFPGVFPAATAIDWAIPAPIIGQRAKPLADNTRSRIKRALSGLRRSRSRSAYCMVRIPVR
jgi:site-specific DNA-cytosine methylase